MLDAQSSEVSRLQLPGPRLEAVLRVGAGKSLQSERSGIFTRRSTPYFACPIQSVKPKATLGSSPGERSMNLTQQQPTRSQPAPILSAGSIALSLLVCCAATMTGCGWEQVPAPAPRANPMLPTLVIVATGDTGGRLTATNCGVARPGGVDRRAALLEALPAGSNPIVLEAGGAASGDLPADRVTWEYLLRAEQALGTAAHNLGREELALAPELLAKLAIETQIPWVSSNTKTAAQNKSGAQKSGECYLSEPLRVVERGTATVVILGVVSPRAATAQVLVEEPASAIRTVLADYGWQQKRPAALIVLADLDADEIAPLRESLPPQTLLINRGKIAPEGDTPASHKSRRVALAQVPAAGEGAVVAEFDLNAVSPNDELAAWTVATPLLDGRGQNPEFTPLLAAYQRELAQGDFTAHDSTWAARTGALAFAGSQHCRACHTTIAMQCDSAPHTAAWQALVDRGQQHEARCQRCHTTGFNSGDQPGLAVGFVSARQTPQFTSVHCEACHGPSAAHTLEPMIPTPWVAKQSCTQCHDAEHSPGFETEAAWLRIHHPPPAAADALESGSSGPRF